MKKGKKLALAIVCDMALLTVLVFAVSKLLDGQSAEGVKILAKTAIVLSIPCMFFMTYMAAAGDKYDTLPEELTNDAEAEDTKENPENAESAETVKDTETVGSTGDAETVKDTEERG